MSSRSPRKPVAMAVLLALVASAAWAEPSIHERITVSPGRRITPHDEAAISSAAVKVLRHIASARGDLQGDTPDMDKALKALDQTERLLDIIQSALPTTRVKDRIWVAKKHLEYESSHEVLPDLVPIYSALDELVQYMPTAKAKNHLDRAREALERDDKPKAREQLAAADDALLYVEADLPLNATRQLVGKARSDLAKGDAKAADRALTAAETNVVFVSVSFQSPLIDAKAALWRARQDYRLGDKGFARTDLESAVRYLERAADGDDPVVRKAAGDLVEQVRVLHQLLGRDDGSFSARMEIAWGRLEALAERSIEYISTGWERMRVEGEGKKELIEAKLQLAYARIDHLYAKDDEAAKVELAEVDGYLKTALEKSLPANQGRIEAISARVGKLEKGIDGQNDGRSEAACFHKTEAELGALIRQL